jgi:hypothetical protein
MKMPGGFSLKKPLDSGKGPVVSWAKFAKARRAPLLIMQLNDRWTLVRENANLPCQVPFSVYDTLVKAGEIPDPYDRENEWISTPVSDRDYLF